MNKQKRQKILLDIVSKMEVDTQEEIIKALREQGLTVTQATVSRDIKELCLVKTTGKTKKYRYAELGEVQRDNARLFSLFKTALTSIEQAQNLVIAKTIIGNASAVAAAIDAQRIPEVIGTLAGDDTVMIVTKSSEQAASVVDKLHNLL